MKVYSEEEKTAIILMEFVETFSSETNNPRHMKNTGRCMCFRWARWAM